MTHGSVCRHLRVLQLLRRGSLQYQRVDLSTQIFRVLVVLTPVRLILVLALVVLVVLLVLLVLLVVLVVLVVSMLQAQVQMLVLVHPKAMERMVLLRSTRLQVKVEWELMGLV